MIYNISGYNSVDILQSLFAGRLRSIRFFGWGNLPSASEFVCLACVVPKRRMEHSIFVAGEQERDRRLILLSVVSGTFLKRTALEPT